MGKLGFQVFKSRQINREAYAHGDFRRIVQDASAAVTEIFLDNAAEITHDPEMAKKIMELPHLVSYQFNHYRSVPVVNGMEEAAVVTSAAGHGERSRNFCM